MLNVRDLYHHQEEYAGREVTVGGWVRSIRDSKAFGFIVSGASLSGADKAFLLITELLFFGAVSLHLGVSFSRSLITMGLLSSDTAEKRADRAAWAISALLMAVSAAALVKFVVSWTGFGG